MARLGVTGKTKEELETLRAEYDEENRERSFDDQYCLAKIPCQPDDYDGPDRYCTIQHSMSWIGGTRICKHHGGNGTPHPENMKPTANMTHGMHATVENLMSEFTEKDQALYDWITTTYPEAYDIDFDEDPNSEYDLHRLAVEIVRAERGRGFLVEEGEVHEQDRYSAEGVLITNNRGEVVTEKSEHYLAGMLNRQDKLITQLQKELGITRKERRRHSTDTDAIDAVKGFAELGAAFLDRENKQYDPDDEPWKDGND